MSIYSTLRAAHYLASDILPALRRLIAPPADDDSADKFAEHLARVRAEALAEREAAEEVLEPRSDCGLGEADECLCVAYLGELLVVCEPCERREALGPYTAPEAFDPQWKMTAPGSFRIEDEPPSAADEPAFTAWLASIDARLAAIQDQLTSAAPGARFTPDAAPESPAPDPGAGAGQPDWCAAEMRQVADILLATGAPLALSYANDLRRAAEEIEHRK